MGTYTLKEPPSNFCPEEEQAIFRTVADVFDSDNYCRHRFREFLHKSPALADAKYVMMLALYNDLWTAFDREHGHDSDGDGRSFLGTCIVHQQFAQEWGQAMGAALRTFERIKTLIPTMTPQKDIEFFFERLRHERQRERSEESAAA